MRTYDEAVAVLAGRESRKVANHTYLKRRDDETIALMLHETDVVTFRPGTVTLDSGGWRTKTTSDRMRYAADVFTRGGQWYVSLPGHRWDVDRAYVYADGITLDESGYLVAGEGERDAARDNAALKRRINRYADKCAKAAPLPHPDGGDCWYCMGMDDGTNPDHLLAHMDEGYLVPTLVYRALEAAGYREPWFLWNQPWAIRRAVREYLKVRLMPDEQVSGFARQRIVEGVK